jgi:phytoene dehydrogenase-like protein
LKYDVAVIGAGAAGLACSRELSGSGKRICLLEARDRAGGRIDTRRLSGIALPIELGAEFIHGESESTFAAVDAASLLAYQLPDNHWWSANGKWSIVDDFWAEIERVRRRIPDRKRDLSFAQFLRTHREIPPRLRELACTFVEGYHAAHADRISALALRTSDEEQEQN